MNSMRRAKKSKIILNATAQEENPEEEAKQKLIELSSNWEFTEPQTHLNNPELVLQDRAFKPEGSKSIQTERAKRYFSTEIKKLTEILSEQVHGEKLEIKSERHYKYGDKYIRIALRNPITASNYLVMGDTKEKVAHSQPNRSQYIIRQQRNRSRIRRQQQGRMATDTQIPWRNKQDSCDQQRKSSFVASKESHLNLILKEEAEKARTRVATKLGGLSPHANHRFFISGK